MYNKQQYWNHICGVMVCVLAWSVVDHRLKPNQVKPKTIKFAFAASPLSMHHYGERAKTGWFRIRIMCPSVVTFLPTDCGFSELAL